MRVFNGNIIGKNKNFFVFLSSWQVCVPIFLLVLAFGIFLTGCENEIDSTRIFIPSEVNRIKVTCNSVEFLQGFNVYFGAVSYSGIGWVGTWSTDITPSYSNTYETCGFKTTNSMEELVALMDIQLHKLTI